MVINDRRLPAQGAIGRNDMSIYQSLTEEQIDQLRALSARTKVPMAEYIRRGVELVLARSAQAQPIFANELETCNECDGTGYWDDRGGLCPVCDGEGAL
jgi:DnaJ-class molecular chaperone